METSFTDSKQNLKPNAKWMILFWLYFATLHLEWYWISYCWNLEWYTIKSKSINWDSLEKYSIQDSTKDRLIKYVRASLDRTVSWCLHWNLSRRRKPWSDKTTSLKTRNLHHGTWSQSKVPHKGETIASWFELLQGTQVSIESNHRIWCSIWSEWWSNWIVL